MSEQDDLMTEAFAHLEAGDPESALEIGKTLESMRYSGAYEVQAMAYADANPHGQPQAVQQNGAIKPAAAHTGWVIQVGALESESEARQRIEVARDQAHGLLSKADPFTEPVVAKGDRKLYRARFAGLDSDQAEAVCRTLKRSDISCFTVRN